MRRRRRKWAHVARESRRRTEKCLAERRRRLREPEKRAWFHEGELALRGLRGQLDLLLVGFRGLTQLEVVNMVSQVRALNFLLWDEKEAYNF